jgi:starvation-inducible DNA-binding protein
MKPKIGITEKDLNKSTKLLTQVLADQMVLYTKTRKFHWNVSGESFMELHKLFESQYKALEETIDEIAERINKLGEPAIGTLAEFAKISILKEYPGKYPNSKGMITELLKDHEAIATELRKSISTCADKLNDAGSADFMTKLLQEHETIAWTLRRYFN